MKRIKLILASLAFVVLSGAAILTPTTQVSAVNALGDACSSSGSSADNPICSTSSDSAPSLVKTLTNILLYIIGALAVVMLIWGGIMYTTSAGDAGRVKKAKDTIMYSIIGIIVALLAYAIVNWVIGIF